MRTIVIRLCDNDFGNTFRNLLETINRVLIFKKGTRDYTQEHITNCILEGIRFHYSAFQSTWDEADPEFNRTVEYLESKVKILFDEKAEKFIEEHDDDHGSWYLEVQTGKVYSF
jgi:hypothetical protein